MQIDRHPSVSMRDHKLSIFRSTLDGIVVAIPWKNVLPGYAVCLVTSLIINGGDRFRKLGAILEKSFLNFFIHRSSRF